jgi:hypothetical protein
VIAIQVLGYDSGHLLGFKEGMDGLFERNAANNLKEDQYIKNFKMTDGRSGQTLPFLQMIQIELPRADRILKLNPPQPGEACHFTEQQWFLSILRHARHYTVGLVDGLQAGRALPAFAQQMFLSLEYHRWSNTRLTSYLEEDAMLEHWNKVYAVNHTDALGRGRKEGLEKGREAGEQVGELRAQLAAIERLVASGLPAEQVTATLQCDMPDVLRTRLAELEAGSANEARFPSASEVGTATEADVAKATTTS